LTLIEKIRQISRLHLLIERKATGSPAKLARRLELSERSIYNLIDQMKSLGAPIEYSQSAQSYQYREAVEFHFGFQLNNKERSELKGGRNKDQQFLILQDFCRDMKYF